ncbi:MAG: hypothetical protein AAFU64_01165 [Bacteroidota bacterium]
MKKSGFRFLIGSCFKDDTLSITINEKLVLDKTVVTTDKTTGLAPFAITYDGTELFLNDEIIDAKVNILNDLRFIIERNSREIFSIDKQIRKGRYFIMDGCKLLKSNLRIVQYKDEPVLD